MCFTSQMQQFYQIKNMKVNAGFLVIDRTYIELCRRSVSVSRLIEADCSREGYDDTKH
jgi:hypothetical protein